MTPVQASRVLSATPEVVFAVLSDPTVKADVVPGVVSAKILGEPLQGPGLRFSETHEMGGREMIMNFEVLEWTEPSHLRIQCLQNGTLWDSSFDLGEHPDGAKLVITMDARAKSVLPRLLNPLMKPLFRRGLTQHLDALEAHFRRGADA